jgi:hypothetical protein
MMASMRLRQSRPNSAPDWAGFNESDPGVVFLELLAYLADALSYFEDQIAAEARLRTFRRSLVALGVLGGVALVCSRHRVCADRLPPQS